MFKTSLLILATLAVTAAAAPAFARTDAVFGTSNGTQLDIAKAAVAQQLEQRGLDVTNVDQWDGYVRADVRLADGTQATRFFEAGSLQPVSVHDLD